MHLAHPTGVGFGTRMAKNYGNQWSSECLLQEKIPHEDVKKAYLSLLEQLIEFESNKLRKLYTCLQKIRDYLHLDLTSTSVVFNRLDGDHIIGLNKF